MPLKPCIALLMAAVLSGRAAVIEEQFATDPFARGWRIFGDSSLFQWNPPAQNISVTWDSSRTNSYCHLPLGTILSQADDFSFSFDLRLSDIRLGNSAGKTNEFQIAIGLIHLASAMRTNHYVGAGVSAAYGIRNVVELDYFPDAGFGETLSSVVVSTNNRIYPTHNFPLRMTEGDTFRITLAYTAADQILRTAATKNGAPFGLPPNHRLGELPLSGKNDFRVDAFAIISYSDAIQAGPPQYHGSILAHGTIDNIRLIIPPPAVSELRLALTNSVWQTSFLSRGNWDYTLERSRSCAAWEAASPTIRGNGATLRLQDTEPPGENAFYRIRAERP